MYNKQNNIVLFVVLHPPKEVMSCVSQLNT